MALPWTENEIEDKLRPLSSNDVMKVFASIVFSRPDSIRHLPDLTKQLQQASNVSDPAKQEDVLNWIDASVATCRMPVRLGVNRPPTTPRPDSRWEEADDDEHDREWGKRLNLVSPMRLERQLVDKRGVSERVSQAPKSAGSSCEVQADDEELDAGARPSIAEDMPDCILQFSTAVCFAKEGEDREMVLDVMRMGSDKDEVSCNFSTEDGDGKAGARYTAVSGELVFKPGEVMKKILVPVIDSRAWSSSLEFKVVLSDAKHCVLGRYLYLCRVKVIDPDCFPTNKYQDKIRKQQWASIPMFGLLIEYFKFNYQSNPIITRRTKHKLFTDQLSNLYFIIKLYLAKVLIDKILHQWVIEEPDKGCAPGTYLYMGAFLSCPDDPTNTDAKLPLLYVTAALLVIPMFFIHYMQFCEVFFKLGGTSRKTLQGNLVRKFLNYDDCARSQLGPSDLIMAMTRDTQSLVHDGYMQLFPLAQNIGKLLMMALLQIALRQYMAVIPALVYPVLLIAFLVKRDKITSQVAIEQDAAQNNLTDYVTQVHAGFRMVRDFLKRPHAIETLEEKIGAFNKKMIASDAVNRNNRFVCIWLSLICTALWLIVGGLRVLDGSDVGGFVTNLAIFNDIGRAWTEIFEVMLKMQGALPYMQKIVRYMNLPIDLEKRMRLNRKRRSMGEELRTQARDALQEAERQGRSVKGAYAADFVPISLHDVSYAHDAPEKVYNKLLMKDMQRGRKSQSQKDAQMKQAIAQESVQSTRDGRLEHCTMSFAQGTLITLVGIPGHGKSTVMRILGSQIVPDGGDLLIPPHLRALHVSLPPTFFNDTLFYNLTYGVSKENKEDGNIARVQEVLRALKVPTKIFQYLDPATPHMFEVKADWGEILSTTERGLLSLARALIANPEILVIHKPTVFFDDATADNTFTCLNEYIMSRGLCMDPVKVSFRRPRTCIITTARPKGIEVADQIFRVAPTRTKMITRKEDIRNDDLK